MSQHTKKPTDQQAASAPKKTSAPTPQKISTQQRNHAFSETLAQARTHMNPAVRVFSRFIHVRFVDILSSFVGSTIARPNAILCGSITSLIATFVLYFAAKYFGYPLSGSESIAAFILGWATGLIFDYTRVLIRGGRA